ncbi:MAG: hypothetical protein AB1665_08325 [Candidatus Thermoplasmatota archaeon]
MAYDPIPSNQSKSNALTTAVRGSASAHAAHGLTNGSCRTNGLTNGLGKKGLTNGNGCTNGLTNGLGKRGLTNGSGRTNGIKDGFTNGLGKRGLTNGSGRTNGIKDGFTNGLTNGLGKRGLTNGSGCTNGLTNGLGNGGFTNGLKPKHHYNSQGALSFPPKKLSALLIIIFIFALPISFLLLMPPPPQVKIVEIDGSFGDWAGKLKYQDTTTFSDPALDITEFSFATNGDTFYGYLGVQDGLMSGDEVDRYIAFIDSDSNVATGYKVREIGAEYLIEVYGWQGGNWNVEAKKFSGNDTMNWSAFSTAGNGKAKSSGNQVEFAFTVGSGLKDWSPRVRFMSAGEEIAGELCTPVADARNGALVITQKPLDSAGILTGNNLMELQLRAVGKAVTVTSITMDCSIPCTLSGFTNGMQIPLGSTVTITVTGTLPSAGTLVSARVSSVVSADAQWSLTGAGLKAYAHSPPAEIAIDGAFGDWSTVLKTSDPPGDATNPNLDIIEYAGTQSTTQTYFYLKVSPDGTIMGGALIPQGRGKPAPPGEPVESVEPVEPVPPKPLPKKTGEETTRIYLDTKDGGQHIGGLRADYLIEIKGFNGAITSKKLYSLPGKHFVKDTSAENGARELEAGVALTDIGDPSALQYYIETTDWRGKGDEAGAQSMRGGDGVRSVLGSSIVYVPDAPATVAQPNWSFSWNLFANDTTDTWSDGTPRTIAEPSVNITDLYSGNDTNFLYIRIKTMNASQDWLTNRTFCVYIDVDGDDWNDWLVKENSTGLEYYNWSVAEGNWTFNNTETLGSGDGDGAVENNTDSGAWNIDFAINKTIVKNQTTVVGSYTKVGAASNNTEDMNVNHTKANATQSFLRNNWNYEDIVPLQPIPEFDLYLIPLAVGIFAPLALLRLKKRRDLLG